MDKHTQVQLCCENGDLKGLKLILNSKANSIKDEVSINIQKLIFLSAKHGHFNIVTYLLEHYNDNKNKIDHYNCALIGASMCGHKIMVDNMIHRGANDLTTSFTKAIYHKQYEIAKYLMEEYEIENFENIIELIISVCMSDDFNCSPITTHLETLDWILKVNNNSYNIYSKILYRVILEDDPKFFKLIFEKRDIYITNISELIYDIVTATIQYSAVNIINSILKDDKLKLYYNLHLAIELNIGTINNDPEFTVLNCLIANGASIKTITKLAIIKHQLNIIKYINHLHNKLSKSLFIEFTKLAAKNGSPELLLFIVNNFDVTTK